MGIVVHGLEGVPMHPHSSNTFVLLDSHVSVVKEKACYHEGNLFPRYVLKAF